MNFIISKLLAGVQNFTSVPDVWVPIYEFTQLTDVQFSLYVMISANLRVT